MSEEEKEYNAGDEHDVKRRKQSRKIRELQKEAALLALMGTPEGRMWMWDLLTECGIFQTSFSSDALRMAFAEGQRNIGLRRVAEINRLGPELYARMVGENTKGSDKSQVTSDEERETD